MKTKPKILITNDDGIKAPGIRYLWEALKDLADLTIVAPASEQSAVGLSITIRSPLRLEKEFWPGSESAWSVTGTPADCVKMALSVVLKETPDLIVSGINRGSNAGRNLLYSGTVAGIIEGIMHDIPGIAFSCRDYANPNYAITTSSIQQLVQHVLKHSLPKGTLLNVNFPDIKDQNIKGIKFSRQGKEYWAENPDRREHPAEGHTYYWLGSKLAEYPEHENSDITWLNKGFATVVPVHIHEMTDHQHLLDHREVFEAEFKH